MSNVGKTRRVLRALARQGLHVERRGLTWHVSSGERDGAEATVLLPREFELESKALRQLATLAAARHPDGGRVTRCCATPDFHPGNGGVAIGSVARMQGIVIPAAVGGDINCGMRLHVANLNLQQFQSQRDRLVDALQGDLFGGTRDIIMSAEAQRGMFSAGTPALLKALRRGVAGRMARADLDQLETELDRTYLRGTMRGHTRWAPSSLIPVSGSVRDPGMATVGGGNHFIEIQAVTDVLDRHLGWKWGLRQGQVAIMIHSGSRQVGRAIGRQWAEVARSQWPRGVPYPTGALFPIAAERDRLRYLEAEATASNYGFVNRLLLAELVRLRLREVFGELEVPLVYDLPHNITLPDGDGWISRKGACPAYEGQPVIIPGSMGTSSYLMVGRSSQEHLCSASHGAGRARTRTAMRRLAPERLGLDTVDCVSQRAERRLEEAPAAYKPIQPVIDTQVEAGIATPVARLTPLLTFKA